MPRSAPQMVLPRMASRTGPVRAVLAALLVAAIGSGCATEAGSDQAEGVREARKAPHAAPPAAPYAGPAGALAAYAANLRRVEAARVAVARRWKLARAPLVAPPPPAVKPVITTRKGFEVEDAEPGLPPVFTTVPVKDRVVFLTMDDGAEKDPQLLRMMSELKIPYSAFLSDYLINDNFGYFRQMQDRGVVLGNHTLHHPYLPGLSYEEQRDEICDQQRKLTKRYGKAPALFRPPFGNYNGDTLRIAKACGVKAVPLWAAEAFPDHMEWREEDQDLHPGDIILTHFRGREEWKGSMPDLVRAVMKVITDKGYAVAKLEDYV
ncbi:polysaccharide deacetylase family protein [Streptomyces sp. NPDC088725]|uniref:polysaccharide deacetylase family protein n=1 Tax=Streptomyces sp. NPDC088725 TaxID=3365873 RepID=UPI0038038399